MSRTYRRKNFHHTQNTSWDTKGIKKCGGKLNTECDYISNFNGSWSYEYRTKTKKEKIKYFIRTHTDCKPGIYGVPSWYNHLYEKKFRMKNKQELCKWNKDHDYEPMCISTPKDSAWDWF